jgi:hypothetical protein
MQNRHAELEPYRSSLWGRVNAGRGNQHSVTHQFPILTLYARASEALSINSHALGRNYKDWIVLELPIPPSAIRHWLIQEAHPPILV